VHPQASSLKRSHDHSAGSPSPASTLGNSQQAPRTLWTARKPQPPPNVIRLRICAPARSRPALTTMHASSGMHPLLETLKKSPNASGGSESRAGRATSSIRVHPPLVPPLHHADGGGTNGAHVTQTTRVYDGCDHPDASSGNDVAPTLTSIHAPSSPMTSGLPTTSHATRSTHEARKPAQSSRNPRPHTAQPRATQTRRVTHDADTRADSVRADS
jgi:hypothetical protein